MGRPRNNPDAAGKNIAPSANFPQSKDGVGKTVKCITTLRPWAVPVGEEEARPLKMGEVVCVPVDQAKNLVRNGLVTLWDADMED